MKRFILICLLIASTVVQVHAQDPPQTETVMILGYFWRFVYVEPGEFVMGSENGPANEKPAHRVKIKKGFYLGEYEVTQALWQAVMMSNPSLYRCRGCPVTDVTPSEVREFILHVNQLYPSRRFHLPTEAEWEYAARAGTTGDYAGDVDSMAWYAGNSGGVLHPVGEKQPNAWGLYDMHGNASEMVTAPYGDYSSHATTDPQSTTKESYLVERGGSFYSLDVRSAVRRFIRRNEYGSGLGFRLVMTAK